MKKLLIAILIILVALAAFVAVYSQRPEFGREPSGERAKKVQASPHYVDGKFVALEPIREVVKGGFAGQIWATIKFVTDNPPYLRPEQPLPSLKTDLKTLPADQDVVIWMGHSSFYMQLGGYKLLIDPVFSEAAAPLPFINKAFTGTNIYTAEDLPEVDAVMISHDHWDHLDYDTVVALKDKVKQVIVPLGIGEYFEMWGYDPAVIHDLDWDEVWHLGEGMDVYVVPTQHFTGRFLKQNPTEAAGFVFVSPHKQVYYSGDGGYGAHHRQIGLTFGPMDLAILENGQYNENWPAIHLHPKQTAQVARDVQAKALMPVHNSKFAMAKHPWDEPMKELAALSEDQVDYELLTPRIGEPLRIGEPGQEFARWWEGLK